ncbi:MAG: phosphatidate cytidylyltransferase [Proteobacteria bacterium]|nr:phosphatidate cytidylyltransferase [Pseudomonadota bacterium]
MGVPLVVLLILFGGRIGLLLLILGTTIQGLREFYRLTLPELRLEQKAAGVALGLLFPVAVYVGQEEAVLAVAALTLVVLFILFVVKPGRLEAVASHLAMTLFGVFYVGFLLSYILFVGIQPRGTLWVFFLLFTVWSGDTIAYFTGTLIGKHKLYPKISPNKSVEGLLGGLAGSIGAALLFRSFLLPDVSSVHGVVLGFFMMILGQVGDFGESMIKRSVKVKDSSQLIPGHGGVLDRVDSFLFTAPFLFYYLKWLKV